MSKKQPTVTVLVFEPGKPGVERTVPNELAAFQAMVGGLIQVFPYEHAGQAFDVMVNDEGKFLGLPANRWFLGPDGVPVDVAVGNLVVIGRPDGAGNTTSVTPAEVAAARAAFDAPEAVVMRWQLEALELGLDPWVKKPVPVTAVQDGDRVRWECDDHHPGDFITHHGQVLGVEGDEAIVLEDGEEGARPLKLRWLTKED